MFGISGFELFIIAAVGLVIFGPDELPKIGRLVGKGLRMFNDARQEVEKVVKTEVLRPEDMHLVRDPLGLKKTKESISKSFMDMAEPPKAATPVDEEKVKKLGAEGSASSIWAAAAKDEAEGAEE